jgi:chromosome segregation ATPase
MAKEATTYKNSEILALQESVKEINVIKLKEKEFSADVLQEQSRVKEFLRERDRELERILSMNNDLKSEIDRVTLAQESLKDSEGNFRQQADGFGFENKSLKRQIER